MKTFNKVEHNTLVRAFNALNREGHAEDFHIQSDLAWIEFDDYEVHITKPMDDTLQFTLNHNNDLIQSIVTNSLDHSQQLPIERAVISLFGVIMLQAFKADWDGFTIREGNTEI